MTTDEHIAYALRWMSRPSLDSSLAQSLAALAADYERLKAEVEAGEKIIAYWVRMYHETCKENGELKTALTSDGSARAEMYRNVYQKQAEEIERLTAENAKLRAAAERVLSDKLTVMPIEVDEQLAQALGKEEPVPNTPAKPYDGDQMRGGWST